MPQSYSHDRYNHILKQTIDQIQSLGTIKGGEYAGDSDRLANFRRNAERLGLHMEQVWAVYAAKHMDSIMQFVQDMATGKDRQRSEPMSSRADDLIVYLILFKCMLDEAQDDPEAEPRAFNSLAGKLEFPCELKMPSAPGTSMTVKNLDQYNTAYAMGYRLA